MIYTDNRIIELIELAKNVRSETNNIEFKDGRGGFSKNVWKTISSFSHNPDGGVIVYGIKENDDRSLEVVGGLNIADLQERINSFFIEKMKNADTPDIKVIKYQGEDLVAVAVKPIISEKKPCYYEQAGLPNGACIRVGNIDKIITFDQLKEFIRNSAPFKFDKTIVKNTTVDMLNISSVEEFLKKSADRIGRDIIDNDIYKILMNLKLIDSSENTLRPTVAGFLIFSKEKPQQHIDFSRYVVRCVRYAGETVASPIADKMDIYGTLNDQIDQAHSFIMRSIPIKAELVGSKRIEKYSYPEEAIREIVANAIVHRDYQVTETYTQINIFSNRIEVSNAGNLPPGVNIENIKEAQFSRNEVISSTLKDMGYMEEYGRGIDLVYSKMRQFGLLDPLFKNKSNSFKVILLGEPFMGLNQSQIIIWQTLQDENEITTARCVELFSNRSRQSVNLDINGLVEKGLIQKKGSGKNTYYQSLH